MAFTNKQFDKLSTFHEKVVDYKDLFKPPTLVTAGSLALVLNGCRSIETMSGVNQIVAGRCGDLLDGYLARLLDQSSDMGALADTAADKIGMAAILYAAWQKEAIPKAPLAVITGKQALNVGLTSLTAYRHPGKGFRPVTAGKYAMAADNAALVGYLYSNAIQNKRIDAPRHEQAKLAKLQRGALLLGKVGFAAGSALSVPATLEYASRALSK